MHRAVLGPFVGTFEIVCGSLVLLGLLTRLAVIPLLVIMAVALTTTKWPMLSAQGLAHGTRVADRLVDVARLAVPADRRTRPVVRRRARERTRSATSGRHIAGMLQTDHCPHSESGPDFRDVLEELSETVSTYGAATGGRISI
jgi:hypothetical protein